MPMLILNHFFGSFLEFCNSSFEDRTTDLCPAIWHWFWTSARHWGTHR